MGILKRLFSPRQVPERMNDARFEAELSRIKRSMDRGSVKVERSLLTLNGEGEPRYLHLIADKDGCHAGNNT